MWGCGTRVADEVRDISSFVEGPAFFTRHRYDWDFDGSGNAHEHFVPLRHRHKLFLSQVQNPHLKPPALNPKLTTLNPKPSSPKP